jgi:hypothetical protein
VEGIGIKISRKIRKFKRIRTPPLCGEYPSWVPYISLEKGERGYCIRYCIRDGIQD